MFSALLSLLMPIAQAASVGPWPDLAAKAAPQQGGENDAALIVAISAYPDLDAIPGASDNADLWYQWLIASRGVAPEHVHRLTDREAVKEAIEDDLAAAAGEVGQGGTLWVVFITHGAPATDGKDVVLVGADATRTARSLYARSVSRSDVLKAAAAAPQAVVVLDSCFSGQGYNDAKLVDDALAPVIPVDALAPVPTADRSTVLVAAGANEFAGPLPGAGRPAFSYLLLGALQGWGDRNGDRTVTPAEAVAWTKGAMSMTVQGRKQTPVAQVLGADVELPTVRTPLGNPELLAIADQLKGTSTVAVDSTLQIGNVDLLKKQQELAEAQREREEAERREQEQREALAAAEKAQVAKASAALQLAARTEWEAASALVSGNSPEARQFASLYLAKYGKAAVLVNGRSYPVEVRELEAAIAVAARSPTEPKPVAATTSTLKTTPESAATSATRSALPTTPSSDTRAYTEIDRGRSHGARTALWVVDALVTGAGVAGLISGQIQANELQEDIATQVVEKLSRATERATLANLTLGLGYGGLAVGAGLGIGLVATHPVDGAWTVGLQGRF